MKKSKFFEQQIAFALRQAETGTKVKTIIRQMSCPSSRQAVATSEAQYSSMNRKHIPGNACIPRPVSVPRNENRGCDYTLPSRRAQTFSRIRPSPTLRADTAPRGRWYTTIWIDRRSARCAGHQNG